jgi:hypothetical protein
MCGVHVPRCFLAYDEVTREAGALIEFFYGYPSDEPGMRFVHGSDLTSPVIRDKKKGRPHSVRYNVRVARRLGVQNAAAWWGQTLVFDALIGNTDRHPDNWGLLVRFADSAAPRYAMAPAFDNGTSLAYELRDNNLPATEDRLAAYVAKGTHHCGWALSANEATPHFALCERFATHYPEASADMKNVIRLSDSNIEALLVACTKVDWEVRFSERRAEFVQRLLHARRAEIERVLDQ